MRGRENPQPKLFVQVQLEAFIPAEHPLRGLKKHVDGILASMQWDLDRLYSDKGRPSIPPEHLLKGELLRIVFSIRSERQLMEQLQYNLLYRWFVGMGIEDKVWDASTYSHNRDRLMAGEIAVLFFEQVVALAKANDILSDTHFSVDGTLLEACASMKSVKAQDGSSNPPEDNDSGNPTVNFKGEKRCNATHQSTTDTEARLYRKGKGKEAKLCYMGHVMMENRHGLVVATQLTHATGTAEREACLAMEARVKGNCGKRITLGADKGYDTKEHIEALRALGVTPHFAQRAHSILDGRTTRHAGYDVSQRKRKCIEEIFGWAKTIGGLRKLRHRGKVLVDWIFTLTTGVYNLIRMNKLLPA